MPIVPVPDITSQYVDTDTGRPTKDFFNWLRQLKSAAFRNEGDFVAAAVPCFSVINSTPQTIGANVYTQLAFDTELYDVGGFFTPNQWTPPAGKVHLSGASAADATTFNNYNVVGVAIFKNGSVRKASNGVSFGTTFGSCHIACDDICNGSDVYTFRAFVSLSSGSATVRSAGDQTWFTGHWISP